MPYTMKSEGFEQISKMLNSLGENAQKVASKGLDEGAGVMAAEIKEGAGKINTAPFHYAVFVTREPSPEEKEIVQKGMGIAKFKKNGADVNTSVGYGNAGYAMLAGKRKPIPLIANAINSGTSFMVKQPVFRQAANKTRAAASAAIAKRGNEILNGIIDGLKVENGMVYVPTIGKKMSVSEYKKRFRK